MITKEINFVESPEVHAPKTSKHMVQYGVWSDCCNSCDFCLRKNKETTTNEMKILYLETIRKNIALLDWKNQFSYGISLLGGELYYIRNKAVQNAFLRLIDDICEIVLTPDNPNAKYSTVSNGMYKPDFLFRVIDRIVEKCGISRVDMNFSYDLKYRYHSEKSRIRAEETINAFMDRYDYNCGIQMILTQNVINLWKDGKFDVVDFIEKKFPKGILTFLYPHPIAKPKKVLPDFNFKRRDLLEFLSYLRDRNFDCYMSFVQSTKNSGTFKYTGLRDKEMDNPNAYRETPILSDGKESIQTKCGHSTLYNCYADSNRCMLCDIIAHEGALTL